MTETRQQKTVLDFSPKTVLLLAGDEIRTRDIFLGKEAFYR